MFKKASKSVCTSTIVVFPDPLSPAPSNSSTMRTPENTEEEPDEPEQADGEISKWNTLVISCTVQYRDSNKKLPERT